MNISLETRYFYKFLQKHNCLRKFINNVRRDHPERMCWDVMNILQFSGCVGIGFIWASSKEGEEYWRKISKEWDLERELRKNEQNKN